MDSQGKRKIEQNQASFEPTRRPQRAAWVKKNQRQLGLLRAVIVAIGVVALLLGLLLLVLPAFKVKEIVVTGNTHTSYEEIVNAADVKAGDEIVGLDLHRVIDNIQRNCPVYVISARVTPTKLVIEVSERETMYVSYADKWFSLDNELNVLDVSDREEDFSSLLKVSLPPIQRMTLHAPIQFCNSDTDLSYIREMVESLDAMALTDRVDLLDVSEKFNVSYVMDGSLRIVLGKVSALNEKYEMAERILLAKGEAIDCAVIDVSDVKKSTFRPVSAVELMA